jgi:hypothetical protein
MVSVLVSGVVYRVLEPLLGQINHDDIWNLDNHFTLQTEIDISFFKYCYNINVYLYCFPSLKLYFSDHNKQTKYGWTIWTKEKLATISMSLT